MLVHYVTFFFAGIMFSDTETEEITSREDLIKIPPDAFAYQFYDREEVNHNDEILAGEPKNRSGLYYPNGTLYTLEKIKLQFPHEKILISNMEGNKWKHIVRTRKGNWQPFKSGKDRIVKTY